MSVTSAIHAGFRQVGIKDDGDKRALYARVVGKDRLTLMTPAEQDRIVEELRKLGFRKAPAERRELTGPYLAKMRALWIAGYNLAVIFDRDDAAMLTFIKGQAKVDDTRFLRLHKDARAAIEGLKAWLAREGGVDWSDDEFTPDYAKGPGFKIAWAQWLRLGGTVNANSTNLFWAEVATLSGEAGKELTAKAWQKVMNSLGKRLRAQKKVAG